MYLLAEIKYRFTQYAIRIRLLIFYLLISHLLNS
jgi:hypothetical protein